MSLSCVQVNEKVYILLHVNALRTLSHFSDTRNHQVYLLINSLLAIFLDAQIDNAE